MTDSALSLDDLDTQAGPPSARPIPAARPGRAIFPQRPPKSVSQATRSPTGFIWWYETIIDEMISGPHQTLGEIAAKLGRSPSWLSLVIHSDSFRARYEERRSEHSVRLSDAIHSKASAVVLKSLDVLLEKLENPAAIGTGAVLEVADRVLEKLGYGAKTQPGVSVTTNGPSVVVVGATQGELDSAKAKLKQLEQAKLLIDDSPVIEATPLEETT